MTNPLNAADTAIQSGYQWIVDWSQKQPRWWLLHTVYLLLIFYAIRIYFGNPGAFSIAWHAAGVVLMWAFAKFAPQEAFGGIGLWRLIFVLMPVFSILDLLEKITPQILSSLGYNLAFVSFFYFVTCLPPKPPIRKTKLAPSTT